jgi:cytochrome oxidase assembly protein ShyY1
MTTEHRWAFIRRTKWVFGHLLALTMVAVMIGCGFWQLNRLDFKRAINDRIEERATRLATDITTLEITKDNVDEFEYVPVTATGRYDTANEVLVRNRTDGDGNPGFGLLTPLVLDDGSAVVVERGWIPAALGQDIDTRPVPGITTPTDEVTVTGLLLKSESRGMFGPRDPDQGELPTLSRVDVARYAEQLDYPVVPMTLLIERNDQTPFDVVPRPFARPDQGEGSHLSYAMQWFIFSTVVALGWPLVLYRTAFNKKSKNQPTRTSEKVPTVPGA